MPRRLAIELALDYFMLSRMISAQSSTHRRRGHVRTGNKSAHLVLALATEIAIVVRAFSAALFECAISDDLCPDVSLAYLLVPLLIGQKTQFA